VDFLEKLLASIKGEDSPSYEVTPQDVSAMNQTGFRTGVEPENIQQTIAQGLQQARNDKFTMDNLPDVSGTSPQNLLNTLSNGTKPFYEQSLPEISNKPLLQQVPKEMPPVQIPQEMPMAKPVKKAAAPAVKEPNRSAEAIMAERKPEQPDYLSQLLKGSDNGVDAEMAAAQAAAAENRRNYILADAAAQIGAGIGRSQYDPKNLDNIKSMVDVPVTNLKEMREAASKKQKDQLDKIGLAKAKMEFTDDAQRSDPKSDVSLLARSSAKDALTRIGRTDLAAKIKDNMSGEQLNKLFGAMSLSNMVTAYEAQQNRLEMAKQRAELKAISAKEKMDTKDTQRLDAANKLVNADIARMNTPFGKNANLVNTAERLEALIANKKPGDVTNQQIYEIARGLDGMVSMGASTIGGTTHLLPRGFMADMAVASEKVKNSPVGAGQAKFVEQALETIRREKVIAKKQLNKSIRGLLGSHMDLAEKHPESWNTMLKMNGIDPKLVSDNPEAAVSEEKAYTPGQESGIQAVMKNNNISREEAIKALKDAGKL
jgi:NACalpha-BTF3-like transcription factor